MKINQAGIDLIHSFESCRLTAYPDPATGGEPITIGWGTTGTLLDGRKIALGMTITQEEADALFARDLARFEDGVAGLVKVPLTENQFAALVSFAYNCGLANLKNSTLLRKLNAGDYKGAADQFRWWNKAGGKVMKGLTRRRQAERELFLRESE